MVRWSFYEPHFKQEVHDDADDEWVREIALKSAFEYNRESTQYGGGVEVGRKTEIGIENCNAGGEVRS